MKMSKKNKRKDQKKAMEELLFNPMIVGKFRRMFQMYDDGDKAVQKTMKRCFKSFIKKLEKGDEDDLEAFVRQQDKDRKHMEYDGVDDEQLHKSTKVVHPKKDTRFDSLFG